MPEGERQHLIAGRMSGVSGIATFCTCGLAFFAGYQPDAVETNESRRAARLAADDRWAQHEREAHR
jgi:hypothetical protein